jgi:hypothetical protein
VPGRGKPFPDVFLAAARMLGRDVGPNEEGSVVGEAEREERARGLVLEDAIPGVQAGKRAGMNGQFFYFLLSDQPSDLPLRTRSRVGSGPESARCWSLAGH